VRRQAAPFGRDKKTCISPVSHRAVLGFASGSA
jgi:hypothetical protein